MKGISDWVRGLRARFAWVPSDAGEGWQAEINTMTGEQRHRSVVLVDPPPIRFSDDAYGIQDRWSFGPWIAGPPPKPLELELDEMAQRLAPAPPAAQDQQARGLRGSEIPTLGFSSPVEGDGRGGLRAVTPTPANPEAVLTLQIEMMPDRSCVLSMAVDTLGVRRFEIVKIGDHFSVGWEADLLMARQDNCIVESWRRAACPSAG